MKILEEVVLPSPTVRFLSFRLSTFFLLRNGLTPCESFGSKQGGQARRREDVRSCCQKGGPCFSTTSGAIDVRRPSWQRFAFHAWKIIPFSTSTGLAYLQLPLDLDAACHQVGTLTPHQALYSLCAALAWDDMAYDFNALVVQLQRCYGLISTDY